MNGAFVFSSPKAPLLRPRTSKKFILAVSFVLAVFFAFAWGRGWSVPLEFESLLDSAALSVPPSPPRAIPLPSSLSHSKTWKNQTVSLVGTVTIEPGAEISFGPALKVLVAAEAKLIIKGKLRLEGPVIFQGPAFDWWHGIYVREGGELRGKKLILSRATTALTCSSPAKIRLQNVNIRQVALGIHVQDCNAAFRQLAIRKARLGILWQGKQGKLQHVSLLHCVQGIIVKGKKRPLLNQVHCFPPPSAAKPGFACVQFEN